MKSSRVWITGAGRGIGRETALLFADRGAILYLSSRSEDELRKVADECAGRGADATPLTLDVRSERSVEEVMSRIEGSGGPLTVLFPCAGAGSFSPIVETDPAEWDRILGTNLTGTYLCMRAAIPGMVRQGKGKIVLISSIAARVPFPNAGAYCASKAGVVALANSVREELRGKGVGVSVVLPGAVASSFWDTIETDLDRSRMLPAALVAEAVVRLAGEPATGTTEELTILPPDGVL